MATSFEFKIPLDPQPMPIMSSDDEESFVVLGKSLVPDVDLSFNNLQINPIQSGPIEEGKKLLNMELAQLEPTSSSQMSSTTGVQEEYDPTLSFNTKSSDLSPEEIQIKVDSLIAENSKLRETIINNNVAMEAQHKRIVEWKEEVQKTHQTHKEKFAEAKDLISKLKAENKLLSLELEKSNEIKEMQQRELFRLKDELKAQTTSTNGKDLSNNSLRSMSQSIIQDEELNASKIKVGELEKLLQTYYMAKDKVEKENDSLKKHVQSLTEQITTLDSSNGTQKQTILELQEKLKDAENSINMLRNEVYCNVNIQEDLEKARKQLFSSQVSITMLQQKNSALLAQLNEEQEKVKESQNMESMKNDCLALQEQIKIYKIDFESERLAKESLKTEKDQLMNDYLNIQKRNNQLNEELELVRERGFEMVRTPNASSSNASFTREQSPLPNQYECPICNLKYRSIKLLEDHVETCIPEPNWL